jgi:hypothetical protein
MPSMYSLSPWPVAAPVFGAHVRSQVHACGVEPAEEGLSGFILALHVIDSAVGGLVVDRFHSLLRQGPGVLDGLFPDLAEA